MFSLCGGIGPVVAMLALPYLGARKSAAWAVGVDLVSYAMLMGFVYAYFIMVPERGAGLRGLAAGALLVLVQVQRLLLLAGLTASVWAARHTPWRDTFLRLAAGAGFGFFLRLVDQRRDQQRPVSRGQRLRPRLDRPVHLLPVGGASRRRPRPPTPRSVPVRGGMAGGGVLGRAGVSHSADRLRAAAACSRSAIPAIRSGSCSPSWRWWRDSAC